jgi:hypothetical protein
MSSRKYVVEEDTCISISLANTANKKVPVIDESFVKAIELEYAVKYLEMLKINPTPKNISVILAKHPLSSCELGSGQNTNG